jgi:hypothetical protein
MSEAEDLIAHLSGGLAPDDREAFRHAAESALAASPQCWGPGSIHRALVPLWRRYFHPPADERAPAWNHRHRPSKLLDAPPLESGCDRRRSRNIRLVG